MNKEKCTFYRLIITGMKILFTEGPVTLLQEIREYTNNRLRYKQPEAIGINQMVVNNKMPKILVIDDYVPSVRYGAGFPRLLSMVRCLAELGYQVTFFPIGGLPNIQTDAFDLQKRGIEIIRNGAIAFRQFAIQRSEYYDIVLVSRPHVFEKALPVVQQYFYKSAIIYDAEALFYTREILKAEMTGRKLQEKEKAKLVNNEIRLIKKADLVIAVSNKTKKAIEEITGQTNINVWEHIQEISIPIVDFNARHDLLFFGSFFAGRGSPNEDAAIYFVRGIFPEIRKALSCKLYIVGTDPTAAVRKLAAQDIVVTGYVENPKTYFDMCRVNVVPTRFASGIPLKLIEVMSYGIPSVVSGLIAEQLDLTDRNEALIGNNVQEFVQRLIELYTNETLWHSLQRNALDYIGRNYSHEAMRDKLNRIVEKGLEIKARKISSRQV